MQTSDTRKAKQCKQVVREKQETLLISLSNHYHSTSIESMVDHSPFGGLRSYSEGDHQDLWYGLLYQLGDRVA